jgi:hypothetical protein
MMKNRTPLTEIGELRISLTDKSYFFKPSFRAMNEIGTPKEIVEMYATLNGADYLAVMQHVGNLPFGAQMQVMKAVSKPVYGRHVLSAAFIIMQSCCDEDISVLVGSYKPTARGVKYVPGMMPVNDIIIIARNLLDHGIIGKSPLKVPQRSESQKQTTNEFNASQYIISARTHFGMTREEAEDLSMTEFQQMIKNKYPEPPGLTREQYDIVVNASMDDREKIKARKQKKKEGIK